MGCIHHPFCGIILIRNPISSKNPGVSPCPFETRPRVVVWLCLQNPVSEMNPAVPNTCHVLLHLSISHNDRRYLLNKFKLEYLSSHPTPLRYPHHTSAQQRSSNPPASASLSTASCWLVNIPEHNQRYSLLMWLQCVGK